ncbi:MAG: SDR family oxidoreductase [Gemmobacter sp.]
MAISGKTVLITGASRGIGAAAAEVFAAAGAKVGLLARDRAALDQLADRIGAAALALPCDVADAEAMRAAVADAEARLGPVAALVNNAGVIAPIARIEDADPADWRRNIDITLAGVFNGIRAVLPGMLSRGGGTVLTVGSGAAHNPLEGWSAYCAAKAGAFMLTRVLHLESAHRGIRAISLSPGTVATDMQAAIRDSGINPVSRIDWSVHVPPEWPARALLWMCSPAADEFLGAEVSLRDEGIRRRIGLIA